jgi:hypothetical protein
MAIDVRPATEITGDTVVRDLAEGGPSPCRFPGHVAYFK